MGALVTWLVSRYFYMAASKDLILETDRLRRLHDTTLLALQNLQNSNSTFQLSNNEDGDLTEMSVGVRLVGVEAKISVGEVDIK